MDSSTGRAPIAFKNLSAAARDSTLHAGPGTRHHGSMDVVLVDRNQSLAQPVRSTLLQGDRLVVASDAQLAGGHWWPSPGHTRAILLVADALDAASMRALHRLWIAEHGPLSYLLTTLGSAGERLLGAVAGPARHHLAGAGWRSTRDLTLAHVLTLERLVQRE